MADDLDGATMAWPGLALGAGGDDDPTLAMPGVALDEDVDAPTLAMGGAAEDEGVKPPVPLFMAAKPITSGSTDEIVVPPAASEAAVATPASSSSTIEPVDLPTAPIVTVASPSSGSTSELPSKRRKLPWALDGAPPMLAAPVPTVPAAPQALANSAALETTSPQLPEAPSALTAPAAATPVVPVVPVVQVAPLVIAAPAVPVVTETLAPTSAASASPAVPAETRCLELPVPPVWGHGIDLGADHEGGRKRPHDDDDNILACARRRLDGHPLGVDAASAPRSSAEPMRSEFGGAANGDSSTSSGPAAASFTADREKSRAHDKYIWEFSVRDGFQSFAEDCQATIETRRRAFQAGTGPRVVLIPTAGKTVLLDLEAMTQSVEGSSRTRGVRRRELHLSSVVDAIASTLPAPTASVPASAASRTAAAASQPATIWEFGVRDGFEAFSTECQHIVEAQYHQYKRGKGPQVSTLPIAKDKVVLIDFKLMKQNLEGSTRQREVRRREVAPAVLPAVVPAVAPAAASWEFGVRDGFVAFGADCQDYIEDSYQAFLGVRGHHLCRIKTGCKVVLVDFKSMRQNLEGSSRQREVRRAMPTSGGAGPAAPAASAVGGSSSSSARAAAP